MMYYFLFLLKTRLSNTTGATFQQGSVLILSLAGVLVASLVLGFSLKMVQDLSYEKKKLIVLHNMTQFQSRLGDHLSDPQFFISVAGQNVHEPRLEILKDLSIELGGKGPSCQNQICRIKLKPESVVWDASESEFSGDIIYEGNDVVVSPISFKKIVAREVLQQSLMLCPNERPLFHGFQKDGQPICHPLPEPSSCNEPGQFLLSSKNNFTVQCESFVQEIGCPITQFLAGPLIWNPSTGRWSHPGCRDREDPYKKFGP
jgi:hypothetical protein